MSARVFPVKRDLTGHTLRYPGRESVKSSGIPRNLFLILLAMCLAAALSAHAETKEPPVSAGTPSAQMSRADRLLLLDNAAELWTMHVSMGEAPPENASARTHFGLVENGRLSPSFTAKTALYLALNQPDEGKVRRVPEARIYNEKQRQRVRVFEGVPDLYDLYIPLASLERVSLEWLGHPFSARALPEAAYILQGRNGVFANTEQLFASWPEFSPGNAFAVLHSLYPEKDVWILEGEMRSPRQKEGDILRIETRSPFRMSVSRAEGHWRILFLEFDRFPQ